MGISKEIMSTSVVTSKGQITIPALVRQKLGIQSGDRVEFVELAGGEFAIKPACHDVKSLKGLLKKPERPVSVEQMRECISRRAAAQ
jgi:antitoxin PrlF